MAYPSLHRGLKCCLISISKVIGKAACNTALPGQHQASAHAPAIPYSIRTSCMGALDLLRSQAWHNIKQCAAWTQYNSARKPEPGTSMHSPLISWRRLSVGDVAFSFTRTQKEAKGEYGKPLVPCMHPVKSWPLSPLPPKATCILGLR
jgi:hypothetical protein